MPRKKRDWLISHPSDNAEVIPIPDEDVKSYNEDRTRSGNVPNLLNSAGSGEEIPCFHVRWQDDKGKERVSFGHTGFFRLAYEKTIGEHIPVSLKDESKIDFTEAIFGNEKTHAGRVFFEDAFLAEAQDDPQLDAQRPQILSTPKPTTFQHYLVQNSDEVKQLNHYNSKTVIRGYKFYWHKSGEQWAETEKKAIAEHPTQYLEKGIRPVKPGTKFHGRIRFENLSDKELGALLFALDLPQSCGHKLGMGKPLGLGSIRITPKLYLSDRQARYRDLFSEWGNNVVESDQLQDKKRAFEEYILDELAETGKQTLWEIDRLRELLVMLRYDVGTELEENDVIRYMRIEPNDFKNRYVLPMPTALLSSSRIDQIMAEVKGQKVLPKKRATHIEEVQITGLWDTFDVTWQLDPKVNILVGINGSGKTTILELINHALKDEYGNVRYAPQELNIAFDNNESIHYQRNEQIEKSRFPLVSEFISTFDTPIGERDEKLSDAYKRHLTVELEERIDRLNTDRPSAGINPAPYTDEFVEIVNEIFERTGKTIDLQFDPDNRRFHVVFLLKDGRELNPDQLSAGEKQILIIVLTALILKLRSLTSEEKHCVFIMDEPEISLHLEWQKNLIDYILRLNENTQIIIATHSPGIIKKGWFDKAIEMNTIKSWRES